MRNEDISKWKLVKDNLSVRTTLEATETATPGTAEPEAREN